MRWRYASTSVAGASHVRSSASCQDACAVSIFETNDGPALVLAVSDGAGSAKAGGIGSNAAVAGVIERSQEWFAAKRTVSEITGSVIRDWVSGIRENIAELAGAANSEMRDYAATLLLAILGQTHSAFAQLGDGALVVLTPEQDWSWVFWPMHGEYSNSTFFVTDAAALQTLQIESWARPVHEVAAFSDGLEPLVLDFKERTAFQPFFARMFRPMRASKADGADETLTHELTAYLNSPPVTSRADDDLTLVLATRLDPPATSATEPTVACNARDSEPAY
jgi:hypothetical protein